MVDVTRHVPSRRAIDRPSGVELEHISCAACLAPICFLGGNAPASIGSDIDASLDGLRCEQTEPGHRAANAKGAEGHRPPIAADSQDVIRNPQTNEMKDRSMWRDI